MAGVVLTDMLKVSTNKVEIIYCLECVRLQVDSRDVYLLCGLLTGHYTLHRTCNAQHYE